MEHYPLITLGIPIYNAADLVRRTLLSALNQTYPNIEYLFVDDKGNSMDVVRSVVEAHPRRKAVRIIDQGTNQGIAAARNAIVDNAAGEFLFTMDCDDVISDRCIELLYRAMEQTPVDFVAASFVRCDLQGNEYPGCRFEDKLIEGDGHPVALYRYGQNGKLFVAAWNKLYKVDFLRRCNIRCQPGHQNEDPWFTYQVIMNARSCRLLPDVTLRYTCNPDSVSGISASCGYSEQTARQYLEVQQLKAAYIRPFAAEPFYRALLADILFMGFYHAFRVAESDRIGKGVKSELIRALLSLPLLRPACGGGGKATVRYRVLCAFHRLPFGCRCGVVRVAGWVHSAGWGRRWLHFKN